MPLSVNQQRLYDVYVKLLKAAIERKPEDYGYPASEAEIVVSRMCAAIEKGTFNKEGALKNVCKELGIPYTYKAINDYWRS